MRALAVVLLLGSCVRFGPDGEPAIDAAPDVDASDDSDAGIGEFGVPRRLFEIEASLEADFVLDDPSISDSGELLFNREDSAGIADIFRAQLNTSTMQFEKVAQVPELSSAMFDSNPHISFDGLTAMVAQGGVLMVATRANESAPWSMPQAVTGDVNSGPDVEGWGQLSADGERLYYTSDRAGQFDIYVATRSGNDYTNSTLIAEVSDVADQVSPKLSKDELTIYLTHNTSIGVSDMRFATRPALDRPFDAPAVVSELDSDMRDADLAVSGDHRIAVFASNRDGTGTLRLYMAVR